MASTKIPGVELICYSAEGISTPDDKRYGPYKLVARLKGVDFMSVGEPADEVIILRSQTLDGINAAIQMLRLRHHPRLISLIVTGPEGEIEKIERS